MTEACAGIAAGFIIHRSGRYLELIWLGTVLLTLGTGLYVDLDARSSLRKIIAFEIISGMGAGLLFEPPLISLQTLVAQDDIATATATFGFIRNLATSLSVVIGGVVFQNGMQLRAPILEAVGLPANVREQLSGKEAAANVMVVATLADQRQIIAVKEAFAWSLRNMWILYASVAVVGVVAGGFISKQHLDKEHIETITGLRKLEKEPDREMLSVEI